jgi:PLP dependent protein
MSGPGVNVDEVVRRLAEVHDRIRAAGGHDVEVLAVTKGFGADAVDAAVAAGCRAIGENYAQELLTKRESLDRHRDRLEVHFIGRLQSNKVRALAGVVDRYSTVDRESLVREIARRDPGARILVQVDTTATPDKGGCAPAVAADLVRRARDAGLAVEGLMTVGPTDGGPAAAEPGFRMVRELVDELDLEVCSMGMSADLEVAVAAGSTEVRLGTALFGQRPPRS